jgi:ATP-dependent protease ClpP protease subunit
MNKFWNFRNQDDTEIAELLLYGDISSETWWGDEITPQQFANDLSAQGGKDINVRINSPGGDVFAAHTIFNLLQSYTGKVTVYVDGLAASAATIIMLAGQKCIMPSNSVMMIHNPAVGLCGYYAADDMVKMSNDLGIIKQSIMNAYKTKCKLDDDQLSQLMDDETWLTADLAKQYGFADEIEDQATTDELGNYHGGYIKVELSPEEYQKQYEFDAKQQAIENGDYEALMGDGSAEKEKVQAMLDAVTNKYDPEETGKEKKKKHEKSEIADEAGDYAEMIKQAADAYGVDRNLFAALVKAESGFNPDAESDAGAIGFTQLMPDTADSLGVNAYDPRENLMGGAHYLRQQLDAFGGNVRMALAAYNAGPGNVQKYGGVPPFEETQNYVNKIIGYLHDTGNASEDKPGDYYKRQQEAQKKYADMMKQLDSKINSTKQLPTRETESMKLAYIMLQEWDLSDFGNRIPQIQFEVVTTSILVPANYSGGSYSELHFNGQDLSNGFFTNSTFKNCIFINCRLDNTDWSSSTLTECNFTGSVIRDSTFDKSTISGCTFNGCDARGTNFATANISGSAFVGADLREVEF